MRTNILICAHAECLGNKVDLEQVKDYFVDRKHEVAIINNFCHQISDGKFIPPFARPDRPVVFAGCSPRVMESKIKSLFDVPVEIANVREQCAWLPLDSQMVNSIFKKKISLALKEIIYTNTLFVPQSNVLKEKFAQYESLIKEMGPNPFKP